MSWDATYLVEAAVVAQSLPRLDTRTADALHIQSGAVYVYGAEYQRLRDGVKWSDGRNLGNGINVYREIATDTTPASEVMTESDLAAEKAQRADHEPYLGALVGLARSRKGGLIKKGIKFLICGQEWNLAAYYTEADAKSGNLLRPRSQLGSTLIPWGLSAEFSAQPRKKARKVAMVDDGGEGPAADPSAWHNAQRVFAEAYPHSALAASAYATLVANSAPAPATVFGPAPAAISALPTRAAAIPPTAAAVVPPAPLAAGPTLSAPVFPAAPQPEQLPLPPAGPANGAASYFGPELDFVEDFAAAEAQLRADILAGGGTIADSPPPGSPPWPLWEVILVA
ncbi:predicted protein [Chaetomium globosum CBS 148.51]|uniref:Uncharacterized protein n=1 Tax=Chaetomium globosum (strain ATCC 6205 / CBS 148.51 / DSM 1962 / NBRC 6347 / NRRL 1970) TaxID=306901 RepID=Q2H693_CHAGB|nr:uncharacterized protein CHGG_05822 [Chaetomium globosum CBS 148.51]EAQ89203.1 predicted protein [Chaetomium globosum CBS 148.51]